MKKFIVLLVFSCMFLHITPANSQKIYVTQYKHQADFIVCEVPYQYQADMLVYEVDYLHLASRVGEHPDFGRWYFVKNIHQADIIIHYIPCYMKDENTLKIFMIEHPNHVGFLNKLENPYAGTITNCL